MQSQHCCVGNTAKLGLHPSLPAWRAHRGTLIVLPGVRRRDMACILVGQLGILMK
jgi:hypothetical protein